MTSLSDDIWIDTDGNETLMTKDVKEAIKEETNEIEELIRIVNGNSPDTRNLSSFKGLIKNQITILKRRRTNKIFGKELV